jgi:NAD(P)H-flavin reductase
VVYGTRAPQDILFGDELAAWRARFDLEVQVTVDRGDERWRGKTGVVTRLIERAAFRPDAVIAMLCGPEVMMRFAARELLHQGAPEEAIYLTLERNMQCAIAHCGHCQMGPELICRDGAVYRYDFIKRLLSTPEM